MKKLLSILLISVLAIGLFVGCGKDEEAEPASDENVDVTTPEDNEDATYEDGVYFATEDGFSEKSGWKYAVTLEVEDGVITSAKWNGAHVDGGKDKVTRSQDGEYVMVEGGTPWHEQAAVAEEFLLENQDPTAITYNDDEGHTDDLAGVSIHVIEFFDLAEKALEAGPVGYGKYVDGAVHSEEPEFNEKTGWKYTFDGTVISGYLVAANWNGVHKDGGDDKNTQSVNGEYVMVEGGTPWHEQAAAAEAFLIENQDPAAITYNDDEGHTDDLAGVSIHVIEFFTLAEEAVELR